MTEAEVERLRHEMKEAEAAMDILAQQRREEEIEFKVQIAMEDVTGDRYDELLAAHLERRRNKSEFEAALSLLERKKRKAELALYLRTAEQDTLAKQAKVEATEQLLQTERMACEEAAREEKKIRDAFLAA